MALTLTPSVRTRRTVAAVAVSMLAEKPFATSSCASCRGSAVGDVVNATAPPRPAQGESLARIPTNSDSSQGQPGSPWPLIALSPADAEHVAARVLDAEYAEPFAAAVTVVLISIPVNVTAPAFQVDVNVHGDDVVMVPRAIVCENVPPPLNQS